MTVWKYTCIIRIYNSYFVHIKLWGCIFMGLVKKTIGNTVIEFAGDGSYMKIDPFLDADDIAIIVQSVFVNGKKAAIDIITPAFFNQIGSLIQTARIDKKKFIKFMNDQIERFLMHSKKIFDIYLSGGSISLTVDLDSCKVTLKNGSTVFCEGVNSY